MVAGCLLILAGLFLPSSTNATIKPIVKSKLVIKPGGVTYDFWKSNPVPIYYSFYFFNVTNHNDVLNNGSKVILAEVGPYVYRVQQDKENITFNTNGTVSYVQRKTYHFDPDRSGHNVSLDDQITHLNFVVVASSSLIHTKYNDNDFMYYVIETGCSSPGYDCALFKHHNVSDLLFDGYDDLLIRDSAQLFPMPFTKFGFFVNRNDTPGADGIYNVYTGQNDINKLGYLANWNYSDHLGFYEPGSKCDSFDYSSAGDFRPPYLLENSRDPIYMFIGDIARSFRMDYQNDVEVNGLSCKRYSADSHLFNYQIEENRCFCLNTSGQITCPENGAANVSASTFGAPVLISFPHFLYANKNYTKHLVGMHPDVAKHGFNFDIEPELAIPMKANAKIQMNFVVGRNDKFTLLHNFPFEELVLPVFWMGIDIEIDDKMSAQLKLVLKTLADSKHAIK